jgi:sulfatase maturation enzyme AslB (radical SAM superfamily)
LPHLTTSYYLNFYGGEPLLAFDLIQKTLSILDKKNKELKKRAVYSLTTNGSLLNEDILQFLNQHKFQVELSFDGFAQDIQRKKGTFEKMVSAVNELLKYPNIDLETNSVFLPQTVHYLSKSMIFLMKLGIPNIYFSLSVIKPWNQESLGTLDEELKKLRGDLLIHYKEHNKIPITNFKEARSKGIFFCAAGQDRLALSPDGQVWGCFLFPDYFKGKENSAFYQKFYFGDLDNFIRNYREVFPRISKNYAHLSMDNFSTPAMKCFLCPELESCAVCPVNASFSGRPLGEIPSYLCQIQRIKIRHFKKFRKDI